MNSFSGADQIFLIIINMSATPIQVFEQVQLNKSSQEEASNCIKCKRSQIQCESSSSGSSQQESQSFSIELKANGLRQSSQKFKYLENEVKRLSGQNQLLFHKNKQLLRRLQEVEGETLLRSELKAKQREIRLLKNQLSPNSYGLTHSKKKNEASFNTINKISIQDYSQRLKLSKSKQVRREESLEDKVHLKVSMNEIKAIKDKFKIEKLQLQKHICLLEEKLLIYEREMNWMLNLAGKTIGLAQKLGFIFKEKPISQKWSAKKQAKQSWRYLKHVLNYFLQIQCLTYIKLLHIDSRTDFLAIYFMQNQEESKITTFFLLLARICFIDLCFKSYISLYNGSLANYAYF